MRLFDLLPEHAALWDTLAEDGGEVSPVIEAWMTDLADREGAKLDSMVGVIRTLEAEAESAKKEADRWAQRAQVRANAKDRIKAAILEYLTRTGRKKVELPSGREISVRANGGKLPVSLADGFDPADLPKDFVRVKVEMDADKVRDSLTTQGDESPVADFCRLGERGSHVRFSP